MKGYLRKMKRQVKNPSFGAQYGIYLNLYRGEFKLLYLIKKLN